MFFQCARAVIRAALWDPAHHHAPESLPSAGDILAACTAGSFDGKTYDEAWPARAEGDDVLTRRSVQAPWRLRAVTSISIFMRGSRRPAWIIFAAGRASPKAALNAGQHGSKSALSGST